MDYKHPNIVAYDDVENLKRFSTESFEKYCQNKLRECEAESEFIRNSIVDDKWEGKICEIGSGNSKLLYSLESKQILKEGIGYEISASRHQFAEKFRTYIGSKLVKNKNSDFLKGIPPENYDLILGVDIVFQFISPLYEQAEEDALKWIYTGLRNGGKLMLELRDFSDFGKQIAEAKNNIFQTWESYPISDPFEFVLAKLYYNSNQHLVWEKTFFERNTMNRSSFTNILKPYRKEEIKVLLEKNGFESVVIYDSTNSPVSDDVYLIVATK